MNEIMKPIDKARLYCETNNHRFTDPRRYVLEILIKEQKPMGAYDVLEKLGKYINKPKPPTAYRAIDFWRAHGFVHKIESLNSFIACCDGHLHHDTHFLVCDDCHTVCELHHHNHKTNNIPDGFTAKRTFIETHGTCGECS
jgi:Fur family transcriptional regulator, zinc uptake regulator